MRKKNGKIDYVSLFILIIVITGGMYLYSKYNFNYFTKTVKTMSLTTFTRDSNVKYTDLKSYKIENKDFNDAMFFKTIEVTPNKAYKVTCMVKTETVEIGEYKYSAGASIGIVGSVEISEVIHGTNDWTEITLMFNSKNRETVDICFRLRRK